jgi:hypothetical protein
MHTLLALLAQIPTDPEAVSLGIQGTGAAVLFWSLKRLGRIERDVAVIKDRMKIQTPDEP